MIWDAIIVGSGPAGAAAALHLAGRCRVLMLDVGHRPGGSGGALDGDQYSLKRSGRGDIDSLIGSKGESLHNIHKEYLSPKLKAPLMRFVSGDWRKLSPLDGHGFNPVLSHARGGLANAWGAGAYRFTARELRRFPVTLRELEPWYEAVEKHIGVCGETDELTDWLGPAEGLLPPVQLGGIGRAAQRAYQRRRASFLARGLRIGQQRLAVLTVPHAGRKSYDYTGMEFFRSGNEGIYNPWFTIRTLVDAGTLAYRDGVQVERFDRERNDRLVEVHGRGIGDGGPVVERCRRLILAAGAINSARIALASRRDTDARLPLRENHISYVPMIDLSAMGRVVEPRSIPAQLVVLYDGPLASEPIQASLYGMSAPLWNDYAFSFPFAAKGTMAAVKYLMPAMTIIQLFYPDCGEASGRMSLVANGGIRAEMRLQARGAVERELLRAYFPAGFVGHPALCQYPEAGNSFHYAGTLPMVASPGRYQCNPQGELEGDPRVLAADAASFSELPSKNLTLTIMANAMRLAKRALATLSGE